jgi:hypothetical protein
MIIVNDRYSIRYAINAIEINSVLYNVHSPTGEPLIKTRKTLITGMAAKDQPLKKNKAREKQ